MAHDVFISYSAEDKPTADAVCATLEARRIRCWIAPRDVLPGVSPAEALIDAIGQSRLMVLVFSSNSNNSPHVMREVERAASKSIAILPLRIEDVAPSKSMEYFISKTHWLDALTPPLEKHLKQLADAVQPLLAKAGRATPVGEEPGSPVSARTAEAAVDAGMGRPPPSRGVLEVAKRWGGRPIVLLALGIGAIVAVTVIVLVAFLSGGEEGDPGSGVIRSTPHDDSLVDTPAATVTDTPPSSAGEPLRIGVLMPFTGKFSAVGPAYLNAAELAVNEINAAGGVLGQPMELVQGDTGSSPSQGVSVARRLIDREGVSAIIGAASSDVTLRVAESVTGSSNVVQIAPSSSSPALTVADDNDFLFRTTISDAAQGGVLAQLAEEEGFGSVCTMFINDAYGQGVSHMFAQNFTGQTTVEVPHEPRQESYAPQLAQCAGTDAVAVISYPESAIVLLTEAVQRGVRSFLFTDGAKFPEIFEQLGWTTFDGSRGTAPTSLDSPAGARFDTAYEAAFGELSPLPFLREGYDAVYVVALAAEKAGATEPAAIQGALRDVANPPGTAVNPGTAGFQAAKNLIAQGEEINYEGAAGPIDFDENGDVVEGAIEVWMIEGRQITTQELRLIDQGTGRAR